MKPLINKDKKLLDRKFIYFCGTDKETFGFWEFLKDNNLGFVGKYFQLFKQ